MQSTTIIAAAGIAEAAWMTAMILMGGGLLVIWVMAIFALTLPSKRLATAAILMLGLFMVFFQPWDCFTPFDAEAYDDPDVVSAAGEFRAVGIAWIVTSLFVIIASVFAWRNKHSATSGDLGKSPT